MFLFTMFSDLGDIIQRGREHEPLTPGEAALLRLFDGLTVAALLAGWAAFQEYGPHIPALTGAAGAVFAALGLAWQQWAAHGGLAAVTGDPAAANAPAATAPVTVDAAGAGEIPAPPPIPDLPVAQASGGVPADDLVPVGAWGSPGVPRPLPLTDASMPVRGPLPPMAPAPLTASMRARLFAMDPGDSGFLLDSQPTPAAPTPRGTLADMPAGGLVRDPADLDIAATGPVPAVTAPTIPALPTMPATAPETPLSRVTRPVPVVPADGEH